MLSFMNVAVNSYLDSFLATQIWMTWQVLGESLPLGEADSLKSLAPCRHRVKLVLPFLSSLWKALKSLNDIEWQWHQHEVSWSCIRVSQIFSALMHTCVKDVLCLVAFFLRYKAQKRSDEDPLASRRGPQGHILHGIREVAKEPSATRRTIEWGFPGMPCGYWMISTISASACSSYICIHMHAAWPYAFNHFLLIGFKHMHDPMHFSHLPWYPQIICISCLQILYILDHISGEPLVPNNNS